MSLSVVSLPYLIVLSLGLTKNDAGPIAHNYAVANIVLCSMALILPCCGPAGLFLLALLEIAGIVLFALSWGWFEAETGYNAIQYARKFGPNEWLNLPLVWGQMYFNQWYVIVGLAIVGVILGIAVLVTCCCGVTAGLGSLFGREKPTVAAAAVAANRDVEAAHVSTRS
ncbi:UNVERIFIED_CONTAM: hypothetical protein HDU68_003169 [Siphonaria sp. JEL0065]|nr:hypothetical protein HDU68_003169 [Siphonaria sp. JEL0065]